MDYEDLLELMRSRRSIRDFEDRRPSRADIERIIEAARWAPTNHNRQGWKFIVFEDRQELADLADRVRASLSDRASQAKRLPPAQAKQMIYWSTIFARAPVAILVMHKRSVSIGRELLAGAESKELVSGEPISAALAVENMLLAAQCLGMGTCVLTGPLLAGEVWRDLGDLPMGFMPTCIVALGYPSRQPPTPAKKPLEQIMEYR